MTVFFLYIIVAPNSSPDGELSRSTKTHGLAAIRQLKRLNMRLDRLFAEDNGSSRYVAGAIRKKNIVRGKPQFRDAISFESLLNVENPAQVGVVLSIASATQLVSDGLGWVPIIEELTMIQLVVSGDTVQLRSIVHPLMRL
jgi:hypothetical protein